MNLTTSLELAVKEDGQSNTKNPLIVVTQKAFRKSNFVREKEEVVNIKVNLR